MVEYILWIMHALNSMEKKKKEYMIWFSYKRLLEISKLDHGK